MYRIAHVFFLQSLTFKEKMTTSLKFKEKSTDLDSRSLLLALVKLIHADPKLMLHVSIGQYYELNNHLDAVNIVIVKSPFVLKVLGLITVVHVTLGLEKVF